MSQATRRHKTEILSVAIAVAAGTFLFFEIIWSQLSLATRLSMNQGWFPAVWVTATAIGASLLCVGIGATTVSGIRVIQSLKRSNELPLQAAAADLLGSSMMVVVGFALSISGTWMLSQQHL